MGRRALLTAESYGPLLLPMAGIDEGVSACLTSGKTLFDEIGWESHDECGRCT